MEEEQAGLDEEFANYIQDRQQKEKCLRGEHEMAEEVVVGGIRAEVCRWCRSLYIRRTT